LKGIYCNKKVQGRIRPFTIGDLKLGFHASEAETGMPRPDTDGRQVPELFNRQGTQRKKKHEGFQSPRSEYALLHGAGRVCAVEIMSKAEKFSRSCWQT
jgi:hypothetical protein